MPFDRRTLLGAGAMVASLAAAGSAFAQPGPRSKAKETLRGLSTASDAGLVPNAEHDQTQRLQQIIDAVAPTGTPVILPPGRFRLARLMLRPGTRLIGVPGATWLELAEPGPMLIGTEAADVRLEGLVVDGRDLPRQSGGTAGLVTLTASPRLTIREVTITRASGNGLKLSGASGCITDCTFAAIGDAALHSIDAAGLEILHNRFAEIGNNAIQVWRSAAGEDGTIVTGNRIEKVRADAGGTGQNGNGINIFRAGNVLTSGNRMTDCAYSAIRANSASNVQMLGNTCQRIGEVALYVEFAFEGAIVSNNLVDLAATGVSVTNFNEGGRLAVVQGNLIRNLVRREHEPEDKRGEGIAVEADAVVTGNVIEGAPTCGLLLGWGRYVRDIVASQNLIRQSRIGIAVGGNSDAGSLLINGNMISGSSDGAIRTLKGWTPTGVDLAIAQKSAGRLQVHGNLVS